MKPWEGWTEATCLREGCFGEEVVFDGWIRQPWNTWSSLAYVAVGLLIWRMKKVPVLLRSLLMISAILTGLGSTFFHVSLSFAGQTADVYGMYLVAGVILLWAISRLTKVKGLVWWWIGLSLACLVVVIFAPEIRRELFAVLLVVGLTIEVIVSLREKRPLKWLVLAVATMAAGYVLWLIDSGFIAGVSITWGHVVWHIAGAVSIVMYGKHCEELTEKKVKEAK